MAQKNSEIQIDQVILHQLDSRKDGAGLLLSDLASVVSAEASDFLARHIRDSLQHRYTHAASFVILGSRANLALDEATAILGGGETDLIQHSRTAAQRLFDIMKRTPNASPGDLVVCTYRDLRLGGGQRLSMLKMDPEGGFQRTGERVDGSLQITLDPIDNVLPTNSQQLQKAAFIFASNGATPLKLRVLDQQSARYGASRRVASFFLDEFLGCKTDTDIKFQTRVFYNRGLPWLQKKEDEGTLTKEEVRKAEEAISTAVLRDPLDIVEWTRDTFTNSLVGADFVDEMRKAGVDDLTFTPDPTFKELVGSKLRFRGSRGLDLTVNSDAYSKVSEENPNPDTAVVEHYDSSTGISTITIRTSKWRRATPRSR